MQRNTTTLFLFCLVVLQQCLLSSALGQGRDIAEDLLPQFGQPRPYELERLDEEVELPATKPKVKEVEDETELLKSLKSLFITSRKENLLVEGRDPVEAVVIDELPKLETPEFKSLLMENYISQPVNLVRLRELVSDVVQTYRDMGMPVVDVVIGEQDITSGTIQLLVFEGKLGTVRAEENRWFTDQQITRQVRMKQNQEILAEPLIDDVGFLNRSPFRSVEVVFEPGEEEGLTDIVLKVEDRFPLEIFVGYEDTGNDLTEEERFVAGFNWGNAFWQDHTLSYFFTTSPNFYTFQSHTLSYVAPLWRGHQLSSFVSISEANADTGGALPVTVNGETIQAGIDYAIELPTPSRTFRHVIVPRFQFRQLENSLDQANVNVGGSLIEILQWSLAYNAFLQDPWGYTQFQGEYFYSPGGLTDLNSTAPFMNARSFADPNYHYIRLSMERVFNLPSDFELHYRLTGQLADSNLIASEQLILGGFNTVRGYTETEARGDEGYFFNLELRTPKFSIGQWFGVENAADQFQFLGFWDYGVVANRTLTVGENPDVELSSMGGGVRFELDRFISVRADYGFQLLDTGFNNRFDSRFHLGVILLY